VLEGLLDRFLRNASYHKRESEHIGSCRLK
jgi:hypothetical protein